MLVRIVLKQFMAHASTEIELGPGLNVLVGPNNIGKSTIGLALKMIARNPNSNFVMRHGAKECSVGVETSEGHSIAWIRRKSPSYLINGVAKDRLGRGGVPEELDETLRLAPVEFEDKDFEPHFGEQKSPIFLINRSPAQIAQFFSTSSDAERLVAMQRLHQRRKNASQQDLNRVDDAIELFSKQIAALEPCVSLSQDMEKLSQLKQEIEVCDAGILKLESILVDRIQLEEESRKIIAQVQALSALDIPPTIIPTDRLEDYVLRLKGEYRVQSYSDQVLKELLDLKTVPEMHDTSELEALVNHFSSQEKEMSSWQSMHETLVSLSPVPVLLDSRELESLTQAIAKESRQFDYQSEVLGCLSGLAGPETDFDTKGLADAIRQMESVFVRMQSWKEMEQVLQELCTMPEPMPVVDLEEVLERMEASHGDLVKARDSVEQIEEDLRSWNHFAEQFVSKQTNCPTCGSKLTVAMLQHSQIVHSSTDHRGE